MAPTNALLLLLPLLPLLPLLVSASHDAIDEAVVYEKFHIDSVIVARYATTRITSEILNSDSSSRELSFQVQLPETAFISSFNM